MSGAGLLDPRLLRSVHLEHDWYADDPTAGYVVGSAAADALSQILPATKPGPRPRAFTLTGPYGTGKSALALFLTDLVAGDAVRQQRARESLGSVASLCPDDASFLPLLTTCRAEAVEELLADACHAAAKRNKLAPSGNVPDLAERAAESGYGGVLVVLDELGKALEHAAQNPQKADLFALQQLAELAARSEFPIIVVGILHQSFAGYADGLDTATRNEWTKIQGRFRDLPFLPSEAMLAHLVAESIRASPQSASEIEEMARGVRRISGLWPASMEEGAFLDLAQRCWPLHPLTVAALPTLMRRFGQNERSLFAFLVERGLLVGQPSHGRGVLLADLFEHVSDWIGHGNRSRGAARRWRLALELLHSRPGWDDVEQDVLRTVALLTALGTFAPFQATTETITLALPGREVEGALRRLKDRSAIVHRRHLGAWVLWEGSDVDVDALIDRARTEVSGRVDIARLLEDVGAMRSPTAPKHYEETGTLRWFRPVVLTDPDGISLPDPDADPLNGVLALAFGANPAAQARFETWASEQERPDLVVAVVHRSPGFRSLAEELEAVRSVDRDAPELRGDRIAREEIASRKASLAAAIAAEAERLLDPSGPDGCLFFHRGAEMAVESRRAFSRLLSVVCDELFPSAPLLKNELINRRSLSSAAAAARRDLIQAMLERAHLPKLGYGDGYPPDRAIYES
ncbi:MAG: hypothetical protein SNJ76_12785, partial [Fimbriimonadaceae bacterium]